MSFESRNWFQLSSLLFKKNVIGRIWEKFVNIYLWEAMAKEDGNTCLTHYFLVNVADTYNVIVSLEDAPVC